MTIYQWLCLLGIPAMIASFIATIKIFFSQVKAIKKGLQALLRAQLISEYNKWSDKGFAPIWARQNFENMWLQYHALGVNGVMDDIHARFMELPTETHTEQEKARG